MRPAWVLGVGLYVEGNLFSDGWWAYRWDAENRLARMYMSSTPVNLGAPNLELRFGLN
ncbi:hypothetical protein NXS98_10715 [Fontisphaera persica]|uniref:hypothetical protein n=1 Tax=Fontisphaera persica TaxID=2974023 RepID=UPI0024BFE668|nr:hypothetical protein [Fontisphaera persica]WCJ58196.1 hypothetical protein NXS98_10715 [Fontisphaera persica]